MSVSRIAVSILFLLSSSFVTAQIEQRRAEIIDISTSLPADIGVAVIDLQSKDTLSVNGHRHFPMQSVFKFHIALAALKAVEEGKLTLDQKYRVEKKHYFPTWSVLIREYPDANVDVTLRDLIAGAAMNSDNVACDMLFEILGGPQVVDEFIRSLGITDISIVATERQMHNEWSVQFDNWTTPFATATLLQLFNDGRILNEQHTAFLWKLMTDTPHAKKRLKGLLPEGTIVAHKSGTGAPNGEGILGAVNDVGILQLPNGRRIVVAVFVSNTKETQARAEEVIAKISRAVYDHYNK